MREIEGKEPAGDAGAVVGDGGEDGVRREVGERGKFGVPEGVEVGGAGRGAGDGVGRDEGTGADRRGGGGLAGLGGGCEFEQQGGFVASKATVLSTAPAWPIVPSQKTCLVSVRTR